MTDHCRPPRRPNSAFSGTSRDSRADPVPLRAKSVNLSERPRSKYGRNIRSADPIRLRFGDKKLFPRQHSLDSKPRPTNNVVVKQLNRKVVEKVPFAVSVQNLSIPMKYADNPKARHSTSKPAPCSGNRRIDTNKTKHCNPPKQVGDNKRLCHTVGGGKETENKLLVQISEAEQVSDFERILNSNAIVRERAQGQVWRGVASTLAPSASVVPRGDSAYSLLAVSQAYHYLFRQHEESLQPLIDRYRQANAADKECPPNSTLNKNWFENLQDLSEFYEDDQALKKEVETITDRIIAEEVQSSESPSKTPNKRHKYFNVNLADLFGLRVNGEGYSPCRDDLGPSPDVDKASENEEEWRALSMSANSDDRQHSQTDASVDHLAQNLNLVQIDGDAKVPTITFSNCCDGRARSDQPNNTDIVIHLAVPSIDSDEARPPMM